MFNGSYPSWYCFGEVVTPYGISDETIHNWIFITLSVSYWTLAVSWFTSFIISINSRASAIHFILGIVALFSGLGAASEILKIFLDGFPVKFFFQSASSALLYISLLLISSGSGITKSGRTLDTNQCFGIASGLAYFGFEVVVISLDQVGLSTSVIRMVGYPTFSIGFATWIAINWIWQVKSLVPNDQPRQLFYRHFMEVWVIYIFSTLVLCLTDFITCKTYWHSSMTNADVITASIGSFLNVLFVTVLMVMLRPTRMQLIGFKNSPSLLEKTDNAI